MFLISQELRGILPAQFPQCWEHRCELALTNGKKQIETGLGFGKAKQKGKSLSGHVSSWLLPQERDYKPISWETDNYYPSNALGTLVHSLWREKENYRASAQGDLTSATPRSGLWLQRTSPTIFIPQTSQLLRTQREKVSLCSWVSQDYLAPEQVFRGA